MKTKITLILALFISIGFINAQDFTIDGVNYKITDSTNLIVEVDGNSCYNGELNLQSTVENNGISYTVSKIGIGAFNGCTTITKITIPNEVNVIGENAFWGCSSLVEVILPESLSAIYNSTFRNCTNLTTINLPNSITQMGSSVFWGCTNLTTITLPSSIEILKDYLFFNSGLTSISLPDSVTIIQNDVFNSCSNLASISMSNSVDFIGDSAFQSCTSLTSISLPTSLEKINESSFEASGLTSIVIPNLVEEIELFAFRDCRNLTNVTMGNSVTSVGISSFQRCIKLETVSLSNSLEEIKNRAFQECYKLTDIVIPNTVHTIADYAFHKCYKLSNVTLPNTLSSLSSYVFDNCLALTEIEIPKTVTTINNFALSNTSLTQVKVNWITPLAITANVFDNVALATADLHVPTNTHTAYRGTDVWKDFGKVLENNSTGPTTAIPDSNFEQALIDLNIDSDNSLNGKVLTSDISGVISLSIGAGNISDLTGIEDFTSLTLLDVNENDLTSIDVSKNLELETIRLARNKLSEIDVTNNLKLQRLIINDNIIKSLDLSKNIVLVELVCWLNDLSTLNIKNGNNTNITNFESQQNPKLLCINVDNANYSATNTIVWTKDSNSTFSETCGEGTLIPDVNFESYLESLGLGNGIIGDKYVNTDQINALTILDVSDKNISDLTGIEAFTSLIDLNASDNQISIINLSNNIDLEKLNLFSNSISSINLQTNVKLKELHVGANLLIDLDVTGFSDLTKLWCFNNQLTKLDLSKNPNLEVLNCSTNQLVNLNVYSNTLLVSIDAFSNKLKYFDIQNNKNLTQLSISNNELTSLNLKNDNTSKINLFTSVNNPNLTCIKVDDVTWATNNLLSIDNTSSFSLDCIPFNDDCSNAIPLTFGQQTPGNLNSGNANNNPSCAVGNVIADVWFSVIVPQSGEFSIEGSGFGGQLKFAIYQSCSSLAPIACGTAISLNNLTVGTTFYLKVWLEANAPKTQNTSETGTFTLKAAETSVLSVEKFLEFKNELVLYPNPASTIVTVKLLNNSGLNKVEVFNTLGKKVLVKNGFNNSTLTINTSNLSKGIYFIKTNTENQVVSKRFIIN
ncbi:leucine-rich repeat protein [Polaribacter sp. Z022]|uniref:leucine-rich repeat protein n=1 Tax=Polaribacter sp. Z022 TaxID=2927125 RepID=UPI002021AF0B|nr:leucine-rich repeat protein [Polaribacter sp. Z022]MCL7752319.1 leucine-rich repeat protein [Polaribacter sp. Z022]